MTLSGWLFTVRKAANRDNWAPEVVAMVSRNNFEQAANSVAALDRNQLKFHIKHFRGRFKLDFSEDYLNSLTVDRLRHILLAALITANPHH